MSPPPRRARLAVLVALGALAAELGGVVVTGGASPLGAVGPAGFAVRLLALAALLVALRPRSLALWLLLLPAVAQLQAAGGRLGGDGVMYYVQARSLYKDGDLDLTDEYAHYGLLERPELRVTTRTGLRRNVFAIGPAVVWAPFFAAGEAVGRIEAALGRPVDLTGYGPVHTNAVALGSLLLGFAAVWLTHSLLRRHFSPGVALLAALLMWWATFLHWYMVFQPAMSHAASAAAVALVLWRWDRDRPARGLIGFALLGLLIGLAMCIRWQNAVFLVLPAIDMVRWGRRNAIGPARLAALAAALAAGTLLGAFPQLAAWKALFGSWVLLYPPQGIDFVRLSRPFLLETLFSSRHGLLSWTPVFWAGFLGFVPLLRRRPTLWPLVLPLVAITYVNACSGDWWAGGSFSNRRFDSLLSVTALGLAAALEAAADALRVRPELALAGAAAPFILANALAGEQVQRGAVSRDDTVAFPSLVGGSARMLADALGSPNTWPASWLFALRHGVSPGRYDRLVGRYLFYRQNNLGGVVDLGAPGDETMLAEGWGPPQELGPATARRLEGRARVFAPLDLPEPLEIRLTGMALALDAAVEARVNGHTVGRATFAPAWSEQSWPAPASVWRRDLNEIELVASAPMLVDRVRFLRASDQRDEPSR